MHLGIHLLMFSITRFSTPLSPPEKVSSYFRHGYQVIISMENPPLLWNIVFLLRI